VGRALHLRRADDHAGLHPRRKTALAPRGARADTVIALRPAPPSHQPAGYSPAAYRIMYDADAREYRHRPHASSPARVVIGLIAWPDAGRCPPRPATRRWHRPPPGSCPHPAADRAAPATAVGVPQSRVALVSAVTTDHPADGAPGPAVIPWGHVCRRPPVRDAHGEPRAVRAPP
jgi:hypothetical protein